MQIDSDIIGLYAGETRLSLVEIEKDLIALENMGANVDLSLAEHIYYTIHVIKNGAGLIGLLKIKELSQKIENVLGLICTDKLIPNPEIINILLLSIDRLMELVRQIDTSDEMDIDEHSVLLTGLTSAVLPDDQKKSITKVRDIPLPCGNHAFQVAEFNLLRGLDQGKHIYILVYDLIRDVQDKKETPLNLIRVVQQHGEMIDSLLDIQTVGTLEEDKSEIDMPYFILLASALTQEQLISKLELKPHQVHQVNNAIADLIHPQNKNEDYFHEKRPLVHQTKKRPFRKSEKKAHHQETLNALSNELSFALAQVNKEQPDTMTTIGLKRIHFVKKQIQHLVELENQKPLSDVLGKLNRSIRDYAFTSAINAKLHLQCDSINMDSRILKRLIEPLSDIVIKMISAIHHQPLDKANANMECPIEITLCAIKQETDTLLKITASSSFSISQDTLLKPISSGKKLETLFITLSRPETNEKSISLEMSIPQDLFIVHGYHVQVDKHHYVIPKLNVHDYLLKAGSESEMWRQFQSSVMFQYNNQWLPVVDISGKHDLSDYQDKKGIIVCRVGDQFFVICIDSTEQTLIDAVCQAPGKHLKAIVGNCIDEDIVMFVPDMGQLAAQVA